MNDEVKEWLGLTKADGVLYIGFGMLGAMFFVRNGLSTSSWPQGP
jgi:hypothetical protein